MNPAFKSKYNQMRESKPTETEGEVPAAPTNGTDNNYSEPGHIRNLCFIWPDGKRQFLNYSYLVSGEYVPQSNTIFLEFTTHTVKVIGLKLLELYDLIMVQLAFKITCTDARYNALDILERPVVNEIEIFKNE